MKKVSAVIHLQLAQIILLSGPAFAQPASNSNQGRPSISNAGRASSSSGLRAGAASGLNVNAGANLGAGTNLNPGLNQTGGVGNQIDPGRGLGQSINNIGGQIGNIIGPGAGPDFGGSGLGNTVPGGAGGSLPGGGQIPGAGVGQGSIGGNDTSGGLNVGVGGIPGFGNTSAGAQQVDGTGSVIPGGGFNGTSNGTVEAGFGPGGLDQHRGPGGTQTSTAGATQINPNTGQTVTGTPNFSENNITGTDSSGGLSGGIPGFGNTSAGAQQVDGTGSVIPGGGSNGTSNGTVEAGFGPGGLDQHRGADGTQTSTAGATQVNPNTGEAVTGTPSFGENNISGTTSPTDLPGGDSLGNDSSAGSGGSTSGGALGGPGNSAEQATDIGNGPNPNAGPATPNNIVEGDNSQGNAGGLEGEHSQGSANGGAEGSLDGRFGDNDSANQSGLNGGGPAPEGGSGGSGSGSGGSGTGSSGSETGGTGTGDKKDGGGSSIFQDPTKGGLGPGVQQAVDRGGSAAGVAGSTVDNINSNLQNTGSNLQNLSGVLQQGRLGGANLGGVVNGAQVGTFSRQGGPNNNNDNNGARVSPFAGGGFNRGFGSGASPFGAGSPASIKSENIRAGGPTGGVGAPGAIQQNFSGKIPGASIGGPSLGAGAGIGAGALPGGIPGAVGAGALPGAGRLPTGNLPNLGGATSGRIPASLPAFNAGRVPSSLPGAAGGFNIPKIPTAGISGGNFGGGIKVPAAIPSFGGSSSAGGVGRLPSAAPASLPGAGQSRGTGISLPTRR